MADNTLFTLTDSGWDQFEFNSGGFASSLIQDLNGDIWIGDFREGIFKISNTSGIVSNKMDAGNIINYNTRYGIKVNDLYKVKSIELFDIKGRNVLVKRHSNSMSLPDLPEGIYLVHVNTTDNKLFTRKIVIHAD